MMSSIFDSLDKVEFDLAHDETLPALNVARLPKHEQVALPKPPPPTIQPPPSVPFASIVGPHKLEHNTVGSIQASNAAEAKKVITISSESETTDSETETETDQEERSRIVPVRQRNRVLSKRSSYSLDAADGPEQDPKASGSLLLRLIFHLPLTVFVLEEVCGQFCLRISASPQC